MTMLLNSFFYLDGFTGQVVHQFTLQTYSKLFEPTNLQIFSRTTLMAATGHPCLHHRLVSALVLHGSLCHTAD